MKYEEWPIKPLSVTSLRLDPSNPRLATSVGRLPQPELIAELLQHEDVMGLARDIAKLGFFPNEPLVAFKDGANNIVVEGNRRLAALKVLLDPTLAPLEFRKRLQQFLAKGRPIPEKVRVVLAPSRDAAIPLIIARHKGIPVHAWTTVQQARFVLERIESGLTVDDVAEETGLERAEVVKQVRNAKLYDVVRSLSLPAGIQALVHDPRRFPFTNLVRLMDMGAVQKHLRVESDEKSGFKTSLGPKRFQSALTRIVTDIAEGTVTSRTTNTAEEVDAYLREVTTKAVKEGDGDSKEVTADDLIDPARVRPGPTPRARKVTRKVRASRSLIPRAFQVDVDGDRIQDLVEELKALPLEPYRNAVAVTFRSLVDMAVTRYLTESGDLEEMIAAERARRTKKGHSLDSSWTPSLRHQLDHLRQDKEIPISPEGRKALGKFLSDTKGSLTLDAMNWFTHNRYVPPKPEELRDFFVMLRPLLELTLQTPEEPEKPVRTK